MADIPSVPLESRRMPLETRVLLKFDRFSGFISEFSSNISQGGMFIRTRTPEPIGTVLDFGFRLGDDYELIHGRGEVVWVRALDESDERLAGMGIRFLELSAGSRELIRKMVETYEQAGGTPFDVAQAPAPPPAAPAPVASPAPPVPLAPLAPIVAGPPAVEVAPAASEPAAPVDWVEMEEEPAVPPEAVPSAVEWVEEPEEELEEEIVSFLPSIPAPAASAPPAPPPPPPIIALGPVAAPGPEPGRSVLPDFDPDSDPNFGLFPDPDPDPEPELEPEPAVQLLPPVSPVLPFSTREPEPRLERTPLPWPVAAAGAPAPLGEPPLAPPAPSRPHAIDLPPRTAPPVFQAAAAPSAGRSRRLVLGGAAAAVVVLVAVLLLARGPLRGLLRLPGSAASASSQAVPPPPERPAESDPGSVALEPPPEMAGTAAAPRPPAMEPSPAPPADPAAPAPDPTPTPASAGAGGEAVAAVPSSSPVPTPAARVEAPAASSSSTFTAVERITWEQSGGATEIVLWGNGAIRRGDFRQVRVGGEPPREVVKLIGVTQPFAQGRLEVGTRQVRQLRIGFHDKPGADELHVVIDLASPDARVTGIQEETGRLRVRIE